MEPPNITISGISSGQVEIISYTNWSIEISERSSIFANEKKGNTANSLNTIAPTAIRVLPIY